MKLYKNKMIEDNNTKNWILYVDLTCVKCGKIQSLLNYKYNDCCIKCGSIINI